MIVETRRTPQDLHAFLQTLFKPWGFGVDYQASRREVRHKVRRLNLHVFDGNRVHFKVRTVMPRTSRLLLRACRADGSYLVGF